MEHVASQINCCQTSSLLKERDVYLTDEAGVAQMDKPEVGIVGEIGVQESSEAVG